MIYGNKAVDGGFLILESSEAEELIKNYPEAKKIIRPLVGSSEFINNKKRYCLWISDDQFDLAVSIPPIKERIKNVKKMRLKSKDAGARGLANRPHQFRDFLEAKHTSIVVPRVSSERREYLAFGFLDPRTIILDSAQAIYDPEPFVFGMISSRMHTVWVKATAGRLESRIRYSSAICYNNFPFPEIDTRKKDEIVKTSFQIISVREKFPTKTIADLYDPELMPNELREAHSKLDALVENCYRSKRFSSDDERLEHLFQLYTSMNKDK